jgi:hypothetical protein
MKLLLLLVSVWMFENVALQMFPNGAGRLQIEQVGLAALLRYLHTNGARAVSCLVYNEA